MNYDILNNIGESIIRSFPEIKGSMLDSNNILWKIVNNEWIGKRSVWTFDMRACWIEETDIKNIKTWWCGEESDYYEIFYRNEL